MARFFLLLLCWVTPLFLAAHPADTVVSGKMRHGKKTGAWHYYNEKHQILKTERYHNGRLTQTYIYNAEGRVIQRISRKGKVTKLRGCGC